uniref:Uncharacterized protein n=1 Tax=Corethron hystrix TaxID=216773 RepID=A0A7S1BNJ5_9STRA|mmetsp:Transcript_33535/g.77344  ORF Transcript_33535/g.77344 Transcript_33535/m.77344 type:complete len:148 (+) Transcript_33535:466-909(+)
MRVMIEKYLKKKRLKKPREPTVVEEENDTSTDHSTEDNPTDNLKTDLEGDKKPILAQAQKVLQQHFSGETKIPKLNNPINDSGCEVRSAGCTGINGNLYSILNRFREVLSVPNLEEAVSPDFERSLYKNIQGLMHITNENVNLDKLV